MKYVDDVQIKLVRNGYSLEWSEEEERGSRSLFSTKNILAETEVELQDELEALRAGLENSRNRYKR